MSLFSKKPEPGTPVITQEQHLAAPMVTSDMIINLISDGIVVIDANGTITTFNAAAERITGVSSAEALKLNFLSILHLTDSDNVEKKDGTNPIIEAVQTKTPVTSDNLFLTQKDGDKINVELSISPISQTENMGAVVILRDITARKKEEAEKTEFISTASHEMRTPVAIIDGYLAMLANPKTATVDARALDYVQKAQVSSKHLGQLFADLLDTTKADDGRLQGRQVPINATDIAGEAVNEFTAKATEKGLTLNLKKADLAPIYLILADKDQVLEILHNLLDNAVKYTATGGVTVWVDGDEKTVRFHIKDTGIGISPEDVPHLFQKFYRIDNSDTREIGGTGLGLYLIKKMVDNMKGNVSIESTVGSGSTFTIEIPRINEADARLASQNIVVNGPGVAPQA